MNRLWRSAPLEDTVWAGWDDVHIVYHRPSGKTHVLNDATAQLLRGLHETPKTVEATALDFSAYQAQLSRDELVEYVAHVLTHLEQLGLVIRS